MESYVECVEIAQEDKERVSWKLGNTSFVLLVGMIFPYYLPVYIHRHLPVCLHTEPYTSLRKICTYNHTLKIHGEKTKCICAKRLFS